MLQLDLYHVANQLAKVSAWAFHKNMNFLPHELCIISASHVLHVLWRFTFCSNTLNTVRQEYKNTEHTCYFSIKDTEWEGITVIHPVLFLPDTFNM